MKHCSVRHTGTFNMSSVNSFWLSPSFHPQLAPQTWQASTSSLHRCRRNFEEHRIPLNRWNRQLQFWIILSGCPPQPCGLPGCGQKHFYSGRKVQGGNAQQALLRTPWANNSGLSWVRLRNPLEKAFKRLPIKPRFYFTLGNVLQNRHVTESKDPGSANRQK